MKKTKASIKSLNPQHWQAAEQAVVLSLRSDQRLTGVPRLRDAIVEMVVRRSFDIEAGMGADFWKSIAPETVKVLDDAAYKAESAARTVLFNMGPIRTKTREVAS